MCCVRYLNQSYAATLYCTLNDQCCSPKAWDLARVSDSVCPLKEFTIACGMDLARVSDSVCPLKELTIVCGMELALQRLQGV